MNTQTTRAQELAFAQRTELHLDLRDDVLRDLAVRGTGGFHPTWRPLRADGTRRTLPTTSLPAVTR